VEVAQLKQTSERASRQATKAEQAATELAQRINRVETRQEGRNDVAGLGGAGSGDENVRPGWRQSHHAEANRGERDDYRFDKLRGRHGDAEASNELAAAVRAVLARISETEEALKLLTTRVNSKAGKESVAAALHRKANKDDLIAAFTSVATAATSSQQQSAQGPSVWYSDGGFVGLDSPPSTSSSSGKPSLDKLLVAAVTAQARAVITAQLPREVATQLSADAVKRAAEGRELQAKEDAKREEVEAATAAQARAKAASFEAFREIIGYKPSIDLCMRVHWLILNFKLGTYPFAST